MEPRYKIFFDGEVLVIVDTEDALDPVVGRFKNPQRAAFVLHVLNGEMSIALLLGLPVNWLTRHKEQRPT